MVPVPTRCDPQPQLSNEPAPPHARGPGDGGGQMTAILREGGGYFNVPNRWFDAGYAKQVPATITNVYMFLCRWEGHNLEDNHASQSSKTIATHCAHSIDVAGRPLRRLERLCG